MEKISNDLLWVIKEEAKDFEELAIWLYYLWFMNRQGRSLIKKPGGSKEVKSEIRLPETDAEIEKIKNGMEVRYFRWLPKSFLRSKGLHPAETERLRESPLEIKKEPLQEMEWWNQFFKNDLLAFDLIVSRIDELRELVKKKVRVTTKIAGADVLNSSPESLYYLSIMVYFFSKLCQNFDVICLEDKKDEVWNTFYRLYKDIKKRGYIFCGYHLSAIPVSMGKTKSAHGRTENFEENLKKILELFYSEKYKGEVPEDNLDDFCLDAKKLVNLKPETIKRRYWPEIKKIIEEKEGNKTVDLL